MPNSDSKIKKSLAAAKALVAKATAAIKSSHTLLKKVDVRVEQIEKKNQAGQAKIDREIGHIVLGMDAATVKFTKNTE